MPNATDAEYADYQAAKAAVDAACGGKVPEDEFNALVGKMCLTEQSLFAAPVASLTDVARKLAAVANWNAAHRIEPEWIDKLLAQVEDAA